MKNIKNYNLNPFPIQTKRPFNFSFYYEWIQSFSFVPPTLFHSIVLDKLIQISFCLSLRALCQLGNWFNNILIWFSTAAWNIWWSPCQHNECNLLAKENHDRTPRKAFPREFLSTFQSWRLTCVQSRSITW